MTTHTRVALDDAKAHRHTLHLLVQGRLITLSEITQVEDATGDGAILEVHARVRSDWIDQRTRITLDLSTVAGFIDDAR